MLQTQWFTDRIGQVVMRVSPDGKTKIFDIDSREVAEYAQSLQAHGYKFKEAVADAGPSANVCISCEG